MGLCSEFNTLLGSVKCLNDNRVSLNVTRLSQSSTYMLSELIKYLTVISQVSNVAGASQWSTQVLLEPANQAAKSY